MNNKNKTKWLVTLTFGVLMAVPTMISYAGVTGKKAVAFGAMNATGPGVKSGDGVEQKQQNHVLQGIAVDVSYDVTRFSLPTGARNLIVVEGFARNSKTAQSGAKPENLHNKVRVIAYHRDSDNAPWVARVKSLGVMGWGGMSNHRFEGSGITPIGLFKMGTAFGRKEAMEGFSKNYVKIDPQAKSQYWSKRTNRLESNRMEKSFGQVDLQVFMTMSLIQDLMSIMQMGMVRHCFYTALIQERQPLADVWRLILRQ